MNTIQYMWDFKPNEKNRFPLDVVTTNREFIYDFSIENPSKIKNLLHTEIFPELASLYELIPHWVIKADLVRLLVVYFKGGYYSDADCFINKIFYKHNDNHNVLLFIEHICNSVHELGPRECKDPDNKVRIANYFFGSKSIEHPFLKEVIDECINRLKQLLIIEKKTSWDHNDILWVCGPDVITTIYHKSKCHYHDIFLYDASFLTHKCYGSWR